jgi:GNAT superfamily N-acetyltransferase
MIARDGSADDLLCAHLRAWLGAWPPEAVVDVVGTTVRQQPGWNGRTTALIGVGTPSRTLLSVPPDRVAGVTNVVGSLADETVRRAIVAALGTHDRFIGRGVFRWSRRIVGPARLADAGEWVDPADPRVPVWLHPFNYGPVLIAWDDAGAYGAGVGIKRHDPVGHEIAVVTTARMQSRGLARRLVAQAARRIVDEGGLPTYLHDPTNVASARVADAVGFRDRGWSVYGLFRRKDAGGVDARPDGAERA